MKRLLARVRRSVRSLSQLPGGPKLVVALSGGADSMALLRMLRELESEGVCRVSGVAHLNHCLRGDAADQDEAFCRSVAAGLGLPFECARVEVAALARERGVSIETAGHYARYIFLKEAAVRLGADFVALAHTLDDQAETFLLRLLRGAGSRGLGGMYPRVGIFVRPLLDCPRAEVRQFVSARGIAFREDATNADRSVARNRLRHDLLPCIEQVQPAVASILGRTAAIAREDQELLERMAEDAFSRMVAPQDTPGTPRVLTLGVREMQQEPAAIQRRVAWKALSRMAGGRPIGFEQVETLLDLVKRPDGTPIGRDLPGQVAERRGEAVTLRTAGAGGHPRGRQADGTNSFRFSLSIPGKVVSEAGWAISADTGQANEWWPPAEGSKLPPWLAVVDAAGIGFPCSVRSWLPGDRLRCIGLGGSKKLQDLFVDRKVPRDERRRVPIVVDSTDRVVWVAGVATSADFAVSPRTRDVVILKLTYWRNGT